jgi:glycosyltransferase involved in cell wall biosynthesis
MKASLRIPPPKNSILCVGNFLSSHGYTRQFIEELADHLQDSGWAVIRTSKIIFRPFRLVNMVFTILARRKKYAVGHIAVFSGPAFIWAEIASWMFKRFRKPYGMSLHGGNLPAFARRWPGRVRRLLNSAVIVIVPSRYLLEQMCPYRSDLRLIPNPLDLGVYDFRPRPNPCPALMWLRSFHKIYNPTLAPEVVARLAADNPDIHLTMVGPDKGDGSLQLTQQVAKDLGVSEMIYFPGGVAKAEVPNWLQRGDIFINTTNVDNTPISVLEAMACGLCVVSTNVGGIPYLLRNEEDALLVPPDDPEAMASAVLRILNEPGLGESLSSNARKKVEQFDWTVILPQWEAIFSEIINKNQRI